jgi:hypothetical protein
MSTSSREPSLVIMSSIFFMYMPSSFLPHKPAFSPSGARASQAQQRPKTWQEILLEEFAEHVHLGVVSIALPSSRRICCVAKKNEQNQTALAVSTELCSSVCHPGVQMRVQRSTALPCVPCFLRACCPSASLTARARRHRCCRRCSLATPMPSLCAPLPPRTPGLMQIEARQRAPLGRPDLMQQPPSEASRSAPQTPDPRHARVLQGALGRARAFQPLYPKLTFHGGVAIGRARQNRKVAAQSFFQPGPCPAARHALQVRGAAAGTVWRSVDFRLLV